MDMHNTAAVGLLELSKSAGFRSQVHTQVQQQFDGDDNALLKDIGLSATSMQQSINQHWGNISDTQNPWIDTFHTFSVYSDLYFINQTINGFPFDEDTLYFQIYVPYIDQVRLDVQPVIAVLTSSETDAVGYRLKENGYFEAIHVNEAFAQQNLVWVISLNETVNSQGVVVRDDTCNNGVMDEGETGVDCGGPCPPCTCFNGILDPGEFAVDCGGPCQPCYLGENVCLPFKEVVLTGFKVDDRQEGGLNGKAEFAFVGYQFVGTGGCAGYERIGLLGSPANESDCPSCKCWLTKVSENQEGDWFEYENTGPYGGSYRWYERAFATFSVFLEPDCPSGNKKLCSRLCRITGEDPQSPPENIVLVFFERDHHHKRSLQLPGCSGKKLVYKSRSTPYMAEFTLNYPDIMSPCQGNPPVCAWLETTYNLNNAQIKIQSKETWAP